MFYFVKTIHLLYILTLNVLIFKSCIKCDEAIQNCELKCNSNQATTWYTINGRPINTDVITCNITSANSDCWIPLSKIFSHSKNASHDIDRLYNYVLVCSKSGLNIHFDKTDNSTVPDPDDIAYLDITNCELSWQTIGEFGNYVYVQALRLVHTHVITEFKENKFNKSFSRCKGK